MESSRRTAQDCNQECAAASLHCEALIYGDYFSAGADFAASFSIIASRTPACSSRS